MLGTLLLILLLALAILSMLFAAGGAAAAAPAGAPATSSETSSETSSRTGEFHDFESFAKSFVLDQKRMSNQGREYYDNPMGYSVRGEYDKKERIGWLANTPSRTTGGIATKEDAIEYCWKYYCQEQSGAPQSTPGDASTDTSGDDEAQDAAAPIGFALREGARGDLVSMLWPITRGIVAESDHSTHKEHLEALVDKAIGVCHAGIDGGQVACEEACVEYRKYFDTCTALSPGLRETPGAREGFKALSELLLLAAQGCVVPVEPV